MVVLTRSRTKAKVLSGMTGSLQILAEFFTVAEVGALCLLSKVVNHAVNDERVWAALCHRDHPSIVFISPPFKNMIGYKAIYRRFSKPNYSTPIFMTPAKSPPPLLPPSCSIEQLRFLWSVKYKGKVVANGVLDRLGKEELIGSGFVVWRFIKPVVLGPATFCATRSDLEHYAQGQALNGLPVTCTAFDPKQLETAIVMIRNSDSAIRRVFDSHDCAKPLFFAPVPMPGGNSNFENSSDCLLRAHPLVEDGVPDLTVFDSTKASKCGCLGFFPPERCSLQPSAQAAEIVRRLPSSTCVGFAPIFRMDIEESNVVLSHSILFTVDRDATCFVGSEDVSLLHVFSEFAGTN